MLTNQFDWKLVASDEGAVAVGEAVAVPATGTYLVRDGVVVKVDEMELDDAGDECWAWTVYTKPIAEE
ncbi:hypothetical protein ACFWPU_00860 [Streptomyces sp. NPDC058471]|uniref:hypothetical protein n=1 Tax=Streptomyces sp. NPDC058471 TaxID=3346516 RepID=UPI00364D3238